MIKVRILVGFHEDEIGIVVGFVVKKETDTYAIVSIYNELLEFKLEDIVVISNN